MKRIILLLAVCAFFAYLHDGLDQAVYSFLEVGIGLMLIILFLKLVWRVITGFAQLIKK